MPATPIFNNLLAFLHRTIESESSSLSGFWWLIIKRLRDYWFYWNKWRYLVPRYLGVRWCALTPSHKNNLQKKMRRLGFLFLRPWWCLMTRKRNVLLVSREPRQSFAGVCVGKCNGLCSYFFCVCQIWANRITHSPCTLIVSCQHGMTRHSHWAVPGLQP